MGVRWLCLFALVFAILLVLVGVLIDGIFFFPALLLAGMAAAALLASRPE